MSSAKSSSLDPASKPERNSNGMAYAKDGKINAGGTFDTEASASEDALKYDRQGVTVLTLESAVLSGVLLRNIGILRKYEDAVGRFYINGSEVRYEVNECFGVKDIEEGDGIRRFLNELPDYICDAISLEIQYDSEVELAMLDNFENELFSFVRKTIRNPELMINSLSLSKAVKKQSGASENSREMITFYSRTFFHKA